MPRPSSGSPGVEYPNGGFFANWEADTLLCAEPRRATCSAEEVVCLKDREAQGSVPGELWVLVSRWRYGHGVLDDQRESSLEHEKARGKKSDLFVGRNLLSTGQY